MAKAHRLTDSAVRALPTPEDGNRITYDGDVPGFGVRVTKAGAKAFIFNYRNASGRDRRMTIGSFPGWTCKQARDCAEELRRRVDIGDDPLEQRQAARTAPTVEAMCDRFTKEQGPRKRPRSAAEDASMIKQLIVPRLGKRTVAEVRRADIEAFHRVISKATPVRANRTLSLLTRMFNLAIGWEWRTDNPCAGVERNHEEKRERFLSPDELTRLMAALADHPKKSNEKASANAIRLLLLTGARRGEVLGATWDQFDLAAGAWTKPASATKQKKLHRVPLSAPALQLLAEMKTKTAGLTLFPGRGEAETQGDIKNFWASICRVAGIEGVRIHDLRHSYASYLASAGMSLPVIGQLLGHSSPITTHRYAHLLDDPLRQATERVGALVTGAGKPGAEVVQLPVRKGGA